VPRRKKQKNEQLSICYTVPEVSVLICDDIRVPLEHIVSRVVIKGAGGYVPVSATPLPPLELNFVFKGGSLEIPPTGAIGKLGVLLLS